MSGRDHYIMKQPKFAALYSIHCELIKQEYEELDSEERDFFNERSEYFAEIIEEMEHKFALDKHEIDLMYRLHSETGCSTDVAYDHMRQILEVLYHNHVDNITSRLGI